MSRGTHQRPASRRVTPRRQRRSTPLVRAFRRSLFWGAYAALLGGLILIGTKYVAPNFMESATTAKGVRPSGAPSGSTEASPSTPVPSAAASPSAPRTQKMSRAEARLAERVRKLGKAANNLRLLKPQVATFTMATYNVLGASHTGGSGAGRVQRGIARLESHGVDLVSLQEFQQSQVRAFIGAAHGRWSVFPGPGQDAENAVAWRNDQFEVLSRETRSYPYFNGRYQPTPVVRLKHRATGVVFTVVSYHNPASTKQFPNQGGWRVRSVAQQAVWARALLASGERLIIGGDMNDRVSYFCQMSGLVPQLHSADGGNHSSGCRAPGSAWIDWLLGGPDVSFSGYYRDHNTGAISDHPIVVSQVSVTGEPPKP